MAHLLWLLVLLKLVTPSLVQVPSPWAGAPAQPLPRRLESEISQVSGVDLPAPVASLPNSVSTAKATSGGASSPEVELPETTPEVARAASTSSSTRLWRPAVVLLWVIGAVAWWGIVGRSSSRFLRLMRLAAPAPAQLADRVSRVAARLGVHRTPAVGLVPARVPPMLWASLTGPAQLILPAELWARLDDTQQDAVLAHELAHLKRRDHWVRRLEAVVLGFYWWDPVAWWARRQLERAEEECCDAWVVWALPDAAPAYADALVATTAFLSGLRRPLPLGASGAGRSLSLKRRLNMIINHLTAGSLTRSIPWSVLIVGIIGLPFLPAMASEQSARVEQKEATRQTPRRDESPQTAAPTSKLAPKPAEVRAPNQGAPVSPRRPCGKSGVAQPIEREVRDVAVLAARLEAAATVELLAQVGGRIDKVLCRPGQNVKKGDVLFEMDPGRYEAEVRKADAEVRRAKARVERLSAQRTRTQESVKNGRIEQGALDQIEGDLAEAAATLQAAEAALETPVLNLNATKVTAPISGTLTGDMPAEGTVVAANTTPLGTIISLDKLYVSFGIPSATALHLRRLQREKRQQGTGDLTQTVMVQLPGESGFPHPANVDFLDVRVIPSTNAGAVRCRAVLVGSDAFFGSPGMCAHVKLVTSAPYKTLVLPEREPFAGGPNLSQSLRFRPKRL